MSELKPVLQLTNAQIYQGSSLILADVNLSIYKGEFVLIFKTNQQTKQYSLEEIKETIIQELKNKNVNLVAKELSLIYNIKKSLIYDFIIKNNLQQ